MLEDVSLLLAHHFKIAVRHYLMWWSLTQVKVQKRFWRLPYPLKHLAADPTGHTKDTGAKHDQRSGLGDSEDHTIHRDCHVNTH